LTPRRALGVCLNLAVVLWLFAIVFGVLAAISGNERAFESEHTFALCAAILFAAWTLGMVLL
jgi:hypothetical protein